MLVLYQTAYLTSANTAGSYPAFLLVALAGVLQVGRLRRAVVSASSGVVIVSIISLILLILLTQAGAEGRGVKPAFSSLSAGLILGLDEHMVRTLTLSAQQSVESILLASWLATGW